MNCCGLSILRQDGRLDHLLKTSRALSPNPPNVWRAKGMKSLSASVHTGASVLTLKFNFTNMYHAT